MRRCRVATALEDKNRVLIFLDGVSAAQLPHTAVLERKDAVVLVGEELVVLIAGEEEQCA